MDKLIRRLFGPTVVFDQDSGNDANNSDANGGNADLNKGGGGGGGDDGKKTAKHETFELKVEGETRQVTLKEIQELAQKAAGADKKFKDASDLRKKAQDGMRLQELITRFSDGNYEPSETEIGELATMINIDPKEFKEYLAADDDGDDDKGKKGDDFDAAFDAAFQKRFGYTPAEAVQREEYRHQQDIDRARKEIRKISDEVVDKDDIFAKIKIGEGGDDRLAVIKDMVAEDVLGRISNGETFGTDLVAASVQKIRAYLKRYGTPGKPDKYPVVLGLGPSGGLPAEVNSEEPIQRKKLGDEGQDDNFVARYMQKGLKMVRESSRRK